MGRTGYLAPLGLVVLLGLATAQGQVYGSLGYREDTTIREDGDECVGTLFFNHDYSFENAYCWQGPGIEPPYYGAYAEAFDLGSATVECGCYWLTKDGETLWDPADIYVWEGGVHGPPGSVLCAVPSVTFMYIGLWPTCIRNDVTIDCCVSGDISIGFWDSTDYYICQYYVCADESGGQGHPWTCIAPGIGYPSGWQPVTIVWPNCRSLGIGATIIETPSGAESRTWGSIKALFE